MSFSITLMRNMSENNKLEKTLETIGSATGVLKNETSILNPTITIEYDLDLLKTVNYFYIQTLGRYYFLSDIRSLRNGLVEISGRVDVLTTYKDAILGNKAIISKQEKSYNCYINDGSLKAYQNPFLVTNYFPSGFSGHGFILAVAGSQ